MKKNNNNIVKLTKKYIIDLLNSWLFENTLTWDGIDNYNELLLLNSEEDDGKKKEQRGGLLVSKKTQKGLLLLVSVDESVTMKVCYRIIPVKNSICLDDPQKTCLPHDYLNIDFSVCDLNLGTLENSSYVLADNLGESTSRLFSLLRFLLDADLVSVYNREIFSDFLLDSVSFPPVAGDDHYQPVFGV